MNTFKLHKPLLICNRGSGGIFSFVFQIVFEISNQLCFQIVTCYF